MGLAHRHQKQRPATEVRRRGPQVVQLRHSNQLTREET